MTIIGLQAGVADDIQLYADEELKRRYLPGFATGELMGAMDLTEPQAGSDLGGDPHARQRGEREDPARRREDLHHERRQRRCTSCSRATPTPSRASKGTTNGLSLYLCPRVLPDGRTNGVEVVRLEQKLGIHGSPTAAIAVRARRGLPRRNEGPGLPRHAHADEQRAPRRRGAGHRHRGGRARRGDRATRASASSSACRSRDQPLMKNVLARMMHGARGQPRAALPHVRADRPQPLDPSAASRASELERSRAREVGGHLRAQRRTHPAAHAAREVSRDRELRRRSRATPIQVHGGHGFMAESAAGQAPRDAIITTIYEGTSRDPGLVRAQGDRQGRARRRVRRGDARARRAHCAAATRRTRSACGQGIERRCSTPRARCSRMSATRCSPRSRSPRVVISVIVAAELLRQAKLGPAPLRRRRLLDRAPYGRRRGAHRRGSRAATSTCSSAARG